MFRSSKFLLIFSLQLFSPLLAEEHLKHSTVIECTLFSSIGVGFLHLEAALRGTTHSRLFCLPDELAPHLYDKDICPSLCQQSLSWCLFYLMLTKLLRLLVSCVGYMFHPFTFSRFCLVWSTSLVNSIELGGSCFSKKPILILLIRALTLLIFICIVLYFPVFPLVSYYCSFLLDYLSI